MGTQNLDLSVLSSARRPGVQAAVPLPKRRWKTRVLLPGAILLCFAAVFGYALRETILPATRVKTVPVVVKMAAGGNAEGVVAQASGWVEPDPFPIYVAGLSDGIVKEVNVLEGQRVKAGDVVVRLIDDDAKLELDYAEAELHHHEHDVCEYKTNVKSAQAEWDHPTERTRAVKVAEAMLAQSRGDLLAHHAELVVEKSKLAELEDQLQRETPLAAIKAVSEFQKVQTELKVQTQKAMIALLEAKQPPLEAKIQQQEAELAAAQEGLALRIPEARLLEENIAKLAAELHTVETIRVKRDQAKLRLSRMEVRSPADGIVMERMVEPGAKLYVNMQEKNSAQALKLYNPAKLQVRVDVPLVDAAKVGVGQKARIVVEVLRDVTFEGVVTRVLHEADIQKNTLQVKVAINSPREELRPEMLARVQLIALEKTDGKEKEPSQRIFARENLIKNGGGHVFTWIVDKGKRMAVHRPVTLGTLKQDGWVEVKEGLQPGDSLIDGDTSHLTDGQRVRIEEEEAPAAKDEHAH